jgi:hypothetical protein
MLFFFIDIETSYNVAGQLVVASIALPSYNGS